MCLIGIRAGCIIVLYEGSIGWRGAVSGAIEDGGGGAGSMAARGRDGIAVGGAVGGEGGDLTGGPAVLVQQDGIAWLVLHCSGGGLPSS